MAIFKGAGVAIVTPFHDNYEVNYEKLGELIDFQIDNQTDAIIICGTTGEPPTMTADEKRQVCSLLFKLSIIEYEHAARLLRVDQVLVDGARLLDALGDDLFRDLVEGHALGLFIVQIQKRF